MMSVLEPRLGTTRLAPGRDAGRPPKCLFLRGSGGIVHDGSVGNALTQVRQSV